eukprot:11626094-Prorocentrum_lima.AAC.1
MNTGMRSSWRNKIPSSGGIMTPDAPPFRPSFPPARASSRRAMEAHDARDEPTVALAVSSARARERTLTPRP